MRGRKHAVNGTVLALGGASASSWRGRSSCVVSFFGGGCRTLAKSFWEGSRAAEATLSSQETETRFTGLLGQSGRQLFARLAESCEHSHLCKHLRPQSPYHLCDQRAATLNQRTYTSRQAPNWQGREPCHSLYYRLMMEKLGHKN